MIYFLLDEPSNAVKVGYSGNKKSLIDRISKLQIGNPHDLKLLFAIPGDRALEKSIHRVLAKYRIRGEWFVCSRFVISTLIKIKIKAQDFDPENDLIA